ncbi:hypothetical protein [Scytonema sp. NUACC26]|uniref:hypothetical protein n=1 Tax=Scytonema sp. NUACC26 TaxID=3140176 RepID=UPI0038B3787A
MLPNPTATDSDKVRILICLPNAKAVSYLALSMPKGKNKFACSIAATHQADIFFSYYTGVKLALNLHSVLAKLDSTKQLPNQ